MCCNNTFWNLEQTIIFFSLLGWANCLSSMHHFSNLGILWFHDHGLDFFCIILLAGELAMDISFTHSIRDNTSNHISGAKFSHMTLSNFKGSKARSFCHMYRKWDLLNICPKKCNYKVGFYFKVSIIQYNTCLLPQKLLYPWSFICLIWAYTWAVSLLCLYYSLGMPPGRVRAVCYY